MPFEKPFLRQEDASTPWPAAPWRRPAPMVILPQVVVSVSVPRLARGERLRRGVFQDLGVAGLADGGRRARVRACAAGRRGRRAVGRRGGVRTATAWRAAALVEPDASRRSTAAPMATPTTTTTVTPTAMRVARGLRRCAARCCCLRRPLLVPAPGVLRARACSATPASSSWTSAARLRHRTAPRAGGAPRPRPVVGGATTGATTPCATADRGRLGFAACSSPASPRSPSRTNCYVVAPAAGEECVVVDPGIGVDASSSREVLAEHRLRPAAVLLTHGHLDHVYSVTPVCGAHGVAGLRPRRRRLPARATRSRLSTRRCWPCSSSSSAAATWQRAGRRGRSSPTGSALEHRRPRGRRRPRPGPHRGVGDVRPARRSGRRTGDERARRRVLTGRRALRRHHRPHRPARRRPPPR